jgi:hypothetical protein
MMVMMTMVKFGFLQLDYRVTVKVIKLRLKYMVYGWN